VQVARGRGCQVECGIEIDGPVLRAVWCAEVVDAAAHNCSETGEWETSTECEMNTHRIFN